MYATFFGLYLGHPETCQLKNICRKKEQKSTGPHLTFTAFIALKYHTKNVTKHETYVTFKNIHMKALILLGPGCSAVRGRIRISLLP